jgi:hypothetical protein
VETAEKIRSLQKRKETGTRWRWYMKMKRNTLINLSLVIVIGILVLMTVYEPGIEKPAEAPLLLSLKRDDVKHILIHRDGQETVELEKNPDGKWQLLQPIKIAASSFRIDSLLRITESKSLNSFSADPAKLAGYKLDKPSAELILNDTVKLAFGAATPLDQRRYVLFDNKVHLITDNLYYFMISAWPTFVSMKPMPQKETISALQLPGLKLQWQDNRWQLKPKQETSSTDNITALLDTWKYLAATSVKVYDGKKGDQITIHFKDEEKPLQFLLTARKPDLILARPELGIEYHFPSELADKILALPKPKEAGKAATPTEKK